MKDAIILWDWQSQISRCCPCCSAVQSDSPQITPTIPGQGVIRCSPETCDMKFCGGAE